MSNDIQTKAVQILVGILFAMLAGAIGACAVVVFAVVPLVTAEFGCSDGPSAGRRPGVHFRDAGEHRFGDAFPDRRSVTH